ncbi:staphylococcal nuclease domain-containing protein 1 [Anopheles arabiensis]|uniref:Staphylococcal nuclease domain-containing protein 1 n=6 Tax=gambiae species complex TaxID=44542 RepID=Q7Q6T9_ANOGA|nr:staphylococcal nuclease domain-containing protein 1 [Anopheles arabiensis]XP_040158902.1 staphylococcal nuclease domain-containing protein 1 [Anopheles arabiensis]XP_040218506.1 staphylococcal nuclease domain-containing protein 1 [Anopheles coluzzii]XP_040218507.1 staphylococcal nuclease domain-containing protein 1 [Anopheles coluzzii]XP_061497437.1 staphylococcal nuclease domain-containing protein 1 [Anopheles gambiae]XP_315689.3 staphylococcal nuclease domain-containing protein 1 [Anophel
MSAANVPAAAANPAPPPVLKKGIVKQILSGDSLILRDKPVNGPPREKQLNFAGIVAPKLARRPTNGSSDGSRDQPYAWESREYLRQRLIGQEVWFYSEKPPNANREYGYVKLGKEPNAENIVESIVSEGLVTVRRDNVRQTPEHARLIELEDAARRARKGLWSDAPEGEHVRNIVWNIDNPKQFVDQHAGQLIKAIIEHVRDGSTVRAFLMPNPRVFQHVTLMMSGIRCPGFKLDAEGRPDNTTEVPYADEARFHVECRLLQREVKVRLESNSNTNFLGTILCPEGNIAESLLRNGFAKCVEWSIPYVKEGIDRLRACEREAKAARLRLWKDYKPPAALANTKDKELVGTVMEVYNGDAVLVKVGTVSKKVFFSSIRPPRPKEDDGPRAKNSRPLYDIPYMFEAREFLRKKLIGKRVTCTLDYVAPARDNYPEKYCYTVRLDDQNIAEAMLERGLATVINYRQDDEQRSPEYDKLRAAQEQAIKGQKGMHAKKQTPSHRINDLTTDHSRIKHHYLPSWQRALRTEALVEFVASGSRLRLYCPKESCLVTFLLAGISCRRSSRPAIGGAPAQEAEPYGDEALQFTREKVLQRDVSVKIETTDKQATSVIGWLFTDHNVNLSVALVEEGLAEVHFTAEKSDYYRVLRDAEARAKAQRKNIWKDYVEKAAAEEEKDEIEDTPDVNTPVERKVKYESVVVTEVTPELQFYAQHTDQGAKLEELMTKLRQDFKAMPPVTGSYAPKRGDMCAAKFSEDNEWYRAKVEKVEKGGNVTILYIDYGNRETVPSTRLAMIPPTFISEKPFAHLYVPALLLLPTDADDRAEAVKAFSQDVLNRTLNMNVEYRISGTEYVTLTDPATKADIAEDLIADGYLIADKNKKDRRLTKLIADYKDAEQKARKQHKGIWQYGDSTEDQAGEFGLSR